MHMEKNDKIPF